MTNTQKLAAMIAQAIKACGGARIDSNAHSALLLQVATESDPADVKNNIKAVGNLSALNQQLEKYGCVTAPERDIPALFKAIKEA